MNHSLSKMVCHPVAAELKLRKLTLAHLDAVTLTREYLIARYAPEGKEGSELTRLDASLNDVSRKVAPYIPAEPTPAKPAPPAPSPASRIPELATAGALKPSA